MKHPPVNRDNFIHELVSKLKELSQELNDTPTRIQFVQIASDYQVRLAGGYEALLKMAGLESKKPKKKQENLIESGPKILLFDIETAPMKLYGWGMFDQNYGLNQIHEDWFVLSWSAKWLGSPENEVMYADVREEPDMSNDSGIISQIWQLLSDADIVIGHNSIKFDTKKLNARFIKHGFPPPSTYRQIDTLRMAKKHFAFTSNKLEYLTNLFCVKFKKLKHSKFSGFDLWSECLKRNPEAWEEMEKYNRYDVLSLEELYLALLKWGGNGINHNVYYEGIDPICSCGSKDLVWTKYVYTNSAKTDLYTCKSCGANWTGKQNVLSKEKKKNLLK